MSMLKTKVYASNVNNLSDARYFAAWGVDYIGFPVGESITSDQINEIINWVEGPTYIGEINKIEIDDLITSTLSQLKIDKVRLNPFYQNTFQFDLPIIRTCLLNNLDEKSEEFILVIEQPFNNIPTKTKQDLRALNTTKNIWLDLPFQPTELEDIMTELAPYGIIVKGGEEERPGVKSFDDLDEIFEILEV